MTDQRATHPCDGCGTYTADRVCPSCWGTTDDPMWCRLCNGVCQEGPGCSPMREDRMTTEGQNTPVSTPSGPSAGLEGQDATQETPDATEAAQRRVERYADEIRSLDLMDDRPDVAFARMARAVIAVADQEWRELYREWRIECDLRQRAQRIADAAEVERDRLAALLDESDRARVNAGMLYADLREAVRGWRQRGVTDGWDMAQLDALLDAPKDTTAP